MGCLRGATINMRETEKEREREREREKERENKKKKEKLGRDNLGQETPQQMAIPHVGCTPKGSYYNTRDSNKGSEEVLGKGLGKGSQKRS